MPSVALALIAAYKHKELIVTDNDPLFEHCDEAHDVGPSRETLGHATDRETADAPKIDRHALVTRHNVTRTGLDSTAPLQVGNGSFAFGADITGLQTFVPFNTMSDWGWHSFPLPSGQRPDQFHGTLWKAHDRGVLYDSPNDDQPELGRWLFENPHRINLGRIARLPRPSYA
jgi:hypothetical protein